MREWLGAMAAGGVVEVDARSDTYRLPLEHAACLTRAARPNNAAATAQWIPLLAGVEDRMVECFERGGGVPYAAYDRFHEVMAEESDQTVVAFLVESILPLVPGLPCALGRGIDVLDVGCGSGRALNRMAAAFPRQPLPRGRPLRRRRRRRPRRGRRPRAPQRPLRGPRRGRLRAGAGLRPRHGVQRDPRPGPSPRPCSRRSPGRCATAAPS